MDAAIENVLREYDQRAAAEMKRMQSLPCGELAKSRRKRGPLTVTDLPPPQFDCRTT